MRGLKRSVQRKLFSKHHKFKFDDVICRSNLYIFNIYNFNKLYHCSQNPVFISKLNDLYTIYDILRFGINFKVDDNDDFSKSAFDFFKETYIHLYFNPTKKNNEDYLISSLYLDQVFKMNVKCIYSTLTNNISFRYDSYLNKFIKSYLIVQNKDIIEYNKNLRKASMYEQYLNLYKDTNNNKKIKYVNDLIFILSLEKKILGNYDAKTILCLANSLTGKLKNYKIIRTKNNIFYDEFKKIKEFDEMISKDKSLIKKIIIGEKDYSEMENLMCNKSKNIFENINNYYPANIEFHKELEKNPFKFLPKMMNISNYLENNGFSIYKIFPTYNDPKIRHIMLDSTCIDNIFLNQKYHNNIIENKENIWKEVFKFPQKFFTFNTNKKYIFEGTIQTDGISMSLMYHSVEDDEKSKNDSKAKLNARYEDSLLKKIISDKINNEKKEIIEKFEDKIIVLKMSEYLYSLEEKKNRDELDDIIMELNNVENDYKNFLKTLSENKESSYKFYKKQQEEIKEIYKCANEYQYNERTKIFNEYLKFLKENNMDAYRKISRKNKECYYLDDLTETELEELRNTDKRIFIDLGKTNLIYALNDYNGKFMGYSSRERNVDLGTKKYSYNTEKLNENLGITKSNNKIKEINRKTIRFDTIINDQKKLNGEYEKMYNAHLSKRFRKEKLQKYMSTQRCESKMIEKMLKQLDIKDKNELSNYILIIGDWGGSNNLKNSKSTLGIGMRRKLKKYFKNMYLLDETRTSLISNLTHEPTKEAILEIRCKNKKDDKEIIITKRMHGILSFKMEKSISTKCKKLYNDDQEEKILVENNEKVIINHFIKRDKNAVLNFKYLLEYYLLNNRERPEIFKRKPKEETKKKINEMKNIKLKQKKHTQQEEVSLLIIPKVSQ
jgi:hypothetical protein